VAPKKKRVKTTKTARPPAKQKKTAAVKPKAAAKKKKSPVKTKTTEKKSSASTAKAVMKKKLPGTMAKKELPAEPNDKNPKVNAINEKNAAAKEKAEALKEKAAAKEKADALKEKAESKNKEVFKLQDVGADKKKELEKRVETKDQLNNIISNKFAPMFSKVVKPTKGKGAAAAEAKGDEIKSNTPKAPAADGKEAAIPVDVPKDSVNEVVEVAVEEDAPNEEGGTSAFGFEFDWKKMEKDPFGALVKFFDENKRERAEEKEVREEENEPMVIVADFTLPYRCCEDYVCEDMCYTDHELAMLPIPPFAKDDFAVTRKGLPVDIYPDMNDSHLFKDFIVVEEIENGENFMTAMGGEVTSHNKKKDGRPHFTYTPPKKQAGISDSFIYTLFNTKNKLRDTATVWIEVAEELPTFSMAKTKLCHNDSPQPIIVDANENEWEEIDVTGTGVIKIIDSNTQVPSWTFDPRSADVIIGSNLLSLTLNGREVGTIDVTVTEIKADFSDHGELISVDPTTRIGTIALHDLSLNVNNYTWEWRVKSTGTFNETQATPNADGVVTLPLPGAPSSGDFVLEVILNASSPDSCADRKAMDVQILGLNQTGTPVITTVLDRICHNASPVTITINPQGNEWDKIDLRGNGVTKSIDASNVPSWQFDPTNEKVILGVNTLRLTLEKQTVEEMDVNVVEAVADFENTGFGTLTIASKPGGFVFFQDKSSNTKIHNWSWESKYGSNKQNISPDKNGVVALPFPTLPVQWDNFTIEMKLTVTSPEACKNTKTQQINVTRMPGDELKTEEPLPEKPIDKPIEVKPFEPVVEKPIDEKPIDIVIEKPIEEKPIDLVVEKPIDEKPIEVVFEKPIDEKPIDIVVEKPIDEKPIDIVVEKPTDEKPIDIKPFGSPGNEINPLTDKP
jgi:hypothetical protein